VVAPLVLSFKCHPNGISECYVDPLEACGLEDMEWVAGIQDTIHIQAMDTVTVTLDPGKANVFY